MGIWSLHTYEALLMNVSRNSVIILLIGGNGEVSVRAFVGITFR